MLPNAIAALTSGAVVAAVLTVSASSASAFTINGTSGTWSNPVGGSGLVYRNVGGENQIRWGSPATPPYGIEQQSGLGFTGVGASTFSAGQSIQLGRLRHFNNPIWSGTAAQSVQLSLILDLAELGEKTFDFELAIDETPNSGSCPYYSVTPCSDKISWNNAFAPNSFKVGNVSYTLQLLGFSNTPGGAIVSDFISQERGTSEAYLFGQLTAVAGQEPEPVPEPTSVAGMSLLGAYFAAKRRQKKIKG